MDHSAILYELIILISATTIFATLFHYLKIPTIVGFILAGVLVGPFGIGLIDSIPGVHVLTEIGVIFLMFTIGLEFSTDRLKYLKRPFWGLGLAQVIITLTIVTLVSKHFFDFGWPKSLFIGCLITLSSTAIVMKLLQNSRETASPYGTTIIGILLCQDLFAIPMILAVPFFAGAHDFTAQFSWFTVATWLGRLTAVLMTIFVFAKYILPYFMNKVIGTRSRELFFSSILLLCFGIAFVMDNLGMSLSLGAFIAGLMIANSPFEKQASSDFIPLRDNFLGLFFASVGMLVDLRFLLTHLHTVLLILAGVFILKTSVIFIASRINRYTASTSAITGLMLFQVGEFSFVIADKGANVGLISQNELQLFLAVSVLTMIATPFAFKAAPRIAFSDMRNSWWRSNQSNLADNLGPSPLKRTVASNKISKNSGVQTIVIGYGVAGMNIAAALKSLEISYTIIDQNYKITKQEKKHGENIEYGDATRTEVLEAAGIDSANLAIVAISGIRMTRQVVDAIRRIRPDLYIIIRTQYAREFETLKRLSNIDVVVAENETTIELLARALTVFGASAEKIQDCMAKTRKQLKETTKNVSISEFLRHSIDLPSRSALSTIRPIRIRDNWTAVGQSLADTDLSKMTGAIAVLIHRNSMESTMPKGDFVFQSGDIIHLIGDSESLDSAESWLSTSKVDVND